MAICYPLSACKWLHNEWPWVAINFTPNSVFVPKVFDSGGLAFKDSCVKTNTHRPIPSVAKCRSITLVSGNISRLQIFEGVSCKSVFKLGWGRWNRRICSFSIAVSSSVSKISSALIAHYDDTTFWIRGVQRHPRRRKMRHRNPWGTKIRMLGGTKFAFLF